MDRVQAVVIRRSDEENTVAILSCDKTGDITSPEELQTAVEKAVTAWVDRTTDGRAAYAENGSDFNLGIWTNGQMIQPY